MRLKPAERYLAKQVLRDLERKMVFVAGPRQVGKTTLAKALLPDSAGYLNWDVPEDRKRILLRELPPVKFWVFDELHKYRSWRNWLKGLFDQHGRERKILVTGSARLDYYRFGGDSLQGRYHYLRMHPLSVAELGLKAASDWKDLLHFGGFPEPFFSHSETQAKRWSREYRTRLINEDLTGLERVQDLGNIELLMLRLPELVSSPLSLNGLREDLRVSHVTVSHWVDILERLYAVFRLAPFGPSRIRAVQKERKHYHFDWSLVPELPQRFENMVASHLLKWTHFQQDALGRDVELRYYRDVMGREVDFVLVENKRPILMVETKWGDDTPSTGLRSLKSRYRDCDALQVSFQGVKDYVTPEGIRVRPALPWLSELI